MTTRDHDGWNNTHLASSPESLGEDQAVRVRRGRGQRMTHSLRSSANSQRACRAALFSYFLWKPQKHYQETGGICTSSALIPPHIPVDMTREVPSGLHFGVQLPVALPSWLMVICIFFFFLPHLVACRIPDQELNPVPSSESTKP